MFKWIEIGVTTNPERYQALSQFLNENHFENSVDFRDVKQDELAATLDELKAQYDGIRIGQGLGEVIIPLFQNNPVQVEKLGAADAIEKSAGGWWLRCHAVEGMARMLAKAGKRFDLTSSALVVGAGAAAKISISALFRVGFKKFSISSLNEKKVETLIAEMKKTHFGVEFNLVPKEGLILLPGTHGVLVNTTPMTKDNPMLEELNYFNFFKSGGVAIDFTLAAKDASVLVGAQDVGAFCVYGYEIAAATDIMWCEKIVGKTLSMDQLLAKYQKIFHPELIDTTKSTS